MNTRDETTEAQKGRHFSKVTHHSRAASCFDSGSPGSVVSPAGQGQFKLPDRPHGTLDDFKVERKEIPQTFGGTALRAMTGTVQISRLPGLGLADSLQLLCLPETSQNPGAAPTQ